MKKVFIIGSKGMAGHVIYNYFKENTKFELVDIARGTEFHKPSYQMDVTNFQELKKILDIEKPDVVINCIGILNKDAEEHPDKAILLNSYLPHFLAQTGTQVGFKLIHISTDCVFNGKKGGYTEISEKDGIGFYAQSKALGEVSYGRHLTLRTSIIGPELKDNGIGLFHWFMNQEGTIKGYSRAYWTGVTTLELSKALVESIKQDISGLHHLVNESKIDKFELTNLFKDVFKKNLIEIEPYDGYVVDKSLIRTNTEFDYRVPTYPVMIKEMKGWIDNHLNLYDY
ncbi:SDR family oxidoreductase [Pedobacter panaciterrae]|uniref:dTDP-4-dehydrorhamnose reductase family protein n=1 Tax=Pedobacter panaciterrae TaxID=363849 RepID=UPI00155DD947|nr:SDR family oxidoreductase [Pedobacter panaciterrae]NQX55200.1 SDR family oxidoreductase [Pedobacter panaciterrae]